MEAESNWEFYKKEPSDKIWWIETGTDTIGEHLFTFDKKKVYNLFKDFPQNLTPEEVEIFLAENEFWKEFFRL